MADYDTVRAGEQTIYRPTCHYAYHPADVAVLSLHEMFGRGGQAPTLHKILDENEIADGADELGVLIFGHAKNAYWYGSQLSIRSEEHTSELQSLMRISYAVFCLKQKTTTKKS